MDKTITFQTINKIYKELDKENGKDFIPVGSVTLTHTIKTLPKWDIKLEEEFEKRKSSPKEIGKQNYTFYKYLRDCLEEDMEKNEYGCSLLTDLQTLGEFCRKTGYVFMTKYDFKNFYTEYAMKSELFFQFMRAELNKYDNGIHPIESCYDISSDYENSVLFDRKKVTANEFVVGIWGSGKSLVQYEQDFQMKLINFLLQNPPDGKDWDEYVINEIYTLFTDRPF